MGVFQLDVDEIRRITAGVVSDNKKSLEKQRGLGYYPGANLDSRPKDSWWELERSKHTPSKSLTKSSHALRSLLP